MTIEITQGLLNEIRKILYCDDKENLMNFLCEQTDNLSAVAIMIQILIEGLENLQTQLDS